MTIFSNNKAQVCGAICLLNSSNVVFNEASEATFIKNIAECENGAAFSVQSSSISFTANSTVVFNYNEAKKGGAISFSTSSVIIITDNSSVTFTNNRAETGEACILAIKVTLLSAITP